MSRPPSQRPSDSRPNRTSAPLDPSPPVRTALAARLPSGRTLAVELRRAARAGLALVGPADPGFPEPLREIPRPPPFLYRLGPPLDGRPAVAVVGSRRATAAAERLAHRLGGELADAGWRVVSGLARGVDRAVLEGAAGASGAPVAVLGNGLPGVYPPEHAQLAERILAAGGSLFSDLPCDAPPRRVHFPRRNRWISGLARGVVVVAATERSGSLITAGWALEQGREVLAVPGPVEGPSHAGCHRLIRDGATLVTNGTEILEALEGLEPRPAEVPPELRSAFRAGERDLSRLQALSGLPTPRLLEAWRRLISETGPADLGSPDESGERS